MIKNGFTIVELMVVVAIIAFLSAISYRSFFNVSTKSKWAEVNPCLSEAVLRLENFRSNHGTYPVTADPWAEINYSDDCSEHYKGAIAVTNAGANYIVAYWDVKKKVRGGTNNDIWAQTDVTAAPIHVYDTVDNIAEALPDGYVLPSAPSP